MAQTAKITWQFAGGASYLAASQGLCLTDQVQMDLLCSSFDPLRLASSHRPSLFP